MNNFKNNAFAKRWERKLKHTEYPLLDKYSKKSNFWEKLGYMFMLLVVLYVVGHIIIAITR